MAEAVTGLAEGGNVGNALIGQLLCHTSYHIGWQLLEQRAYLLHWARLHCLRSNMTEAVAHVHRKVREEERSDGDGQKRATECALVVGFHAERQSPCLAGAGRARFEVKRRVSPVRVGARFEPFRLGGIGWRTLLYITGVRVLFVGFLISVTISCQAAAQTGGSD